MEIPMSEPYHIELGNRGCIECHHGETWDIIDPEGVALATSYGDKEEAEEVCEMLNRSFYFGERSGSDVSPEGCWLSREQDFLKEVSGTVGFDIGGGFSVFLHPKGFDKCFLGTADTLEEAMARARQDMNEAIAKGSQAPAQPAPEVPIESKPNDDFPF
jgi:hypothetical protein